MKPTELNPHPHEVIEQSDELRHQRLAAERQAQRQAGEGASSADFTGEQPSNQPVRCSDWLGDDPAEDHWFLKHLMDAHTVVLCNNECDVIAFSALGMKSFGALDRELFNSLVAIMAERKGIKWSVGRFPNQL